MIYLKVYNVHISDFRYTLIFTIITITIMPKIEAKKEEGDWLKEAMESLWGQNRFWTSVKHLENIGLLDKKDLSKLKKKKIEYLLVGIVKQEYIKTKKQITHIKTTVNLLNGDFDITKEKKASIKKINTDYEEYYSGST